MNLFRFFVHMMFRDVYSYGSYETCYANARSFRNYIVKSHETGKSKPCGSLALRSQSSSLTQIRCIEESGVCCFKIGPCLVSLLYNFSALASKTRQYRELVVCLNGFYDV